jgi:hypothetical protein
MTGRRKHQATVLRIDSPMGHRKALDHANDLSRQAAAFKEALPGEAWEAWVEDYMSQRYRDSPRMLTASKSAWSQLREFFTLRDLRTSRALGYFTSHYLYERRMV